MLNQFLALATRAVAALEKIAENTRPDTVTPTQLTDKKLEREKERLNNYLVDSESIRKGGWRV